MDSQQDRFSFVLTEKELPAQSGTLLLVSLAGPIQRSTSAHFEKLIEEIGSKKADWIVLNFRDVPKQIERPMYPNLARVQKLVRDKPAELKICELDRELRVSLEQAGIIRPQEVVGSLAQALLALTPKKTP